MTLAMIFPGQGSQASGMQASLAEKYSEVRETYSEASGELGFDLWELVQQGPAEGLNATVVTQPAMLTAGVAAWRAWRAAGGGAPRYMAGHSLGEYTALVCAGSLHFRHAVRLVEHRAELMQSAVPAGNGAMAAIIGLADDVVIDVCHRAAQGQVVSAVNFNSPGQVVIAGDRDAVERAADAAKKAGAKRALLLNVSVPSHCELMRPAAEKLADALAEVDISPPSIPVVNNADVRVYEDAGQIRDGLARQLYSPVRWADTIRFMAGNGATSTIEAGPGKVLTGLVRRIDRSISAFSIDSPEALQDAIAKLKEPDQ